MVVANRVQLGVALLVVVDAAHGAGVHASVRRVRIRESVVLRVLLNLADGSKDSCLQRQLYPVQRPAQVGFYGRVQAFSIIVLVGRFFRVLGVAFTVYHERDSQDDPALGGPATVEDGRECVGSYVDRLLLSFDVVDTVFFRECVLALNGM